jgi:phosphorylcholine metabolism protein LicD
MSNTDIINLRKGQHIMKDMLKEFHNLCICNNIKYWSQAGTLIGAVRHNGWIPWDGDVDVSMLTDDYKKLKNIIHILPNDIIFSEPKDKPCAKIRTTKAIYEPSSYSQKDDWNMGIQIDIFLYDIEPLTNNKFIIGEWPVCGTPGKNIVPYEDIFPLKKKKFDDIYIYVPNKYKKICKETWGDYPPPLIPIDERVCHEGRVKIL